MRKKERQIEIERTKLGEVTFIDICGTYEWYIERVVYRYLMSRGSRHVPRK